MVVWALNVKMTLSLPRLISTSRTASKTCPREVSGDLLLIPDTGGRKTEQTPIGGWGWIRSGAETPTGNPSPAPSSSAAHASHAQHDRSMARWISVARAKVGGHGSSPTASQKVAPSRACPFVRFEPGITMVFWWTCPSGTAKIRFW